MFCVCRSNRFWDEVDLNPTVTTSKICKCKDRTTSLQNCSNFLLLSTTDFLRLFGAAKLFKKYNMSTGILIVIQQEELEDAHRPKLAHHPFHTLLFRFPHAKKQIGPPQKTKTNQNTNKSNKAPKQTITN